MKNIKLKSLLSEESNTSKELDDKEYQLGKKLFKLDKQLEPLLQKQIDYHEEMLDIFELQKKNGDKDVDSYMKEIRKWISEIQNIQKKMKQGLW